MAMDQKWTKYSYVCQGCDSLFEITCLNPKTYEPQCCGYMVNVSVVDATINNNNETKEVPPMHATTDFLERQVAALQEHVDKKDAYIERLQDEVSQKTNTIFTIRAEQRNLANTMKEFVIQSMSDREMMQGTAEAIAEIMDFELSKTITITATVDFEVEVEVPFDVDADDVIASLEYSVDAFDYSITDFSLDTRQVDWSDNIS